MFLKSKFKNSEKSPPIKNNFKDTLVFLNNFHRKNLKYAFFEFLNNFKNHTI